MAPEAEGAEEGIGVFAAADAVGKAVQEFGIAPAEDDVVGFERGFQFPHHVHHVAAPLLLAQALQTRFADVVLIGAAMLVRKMGELEGLQDSVHNQRGTETRAQAEEQHAAAVVAAEGLHGRVIEDPDRMMEGFAEVEADPASAEIVGLGYGLAVEYRAGITDGNDIVLPLGDGAEDVGDHLAGCHSRAGVNFDGGTMAGGEEFDVRAADVNGEDA